MPHTSKPTADDVVHASPGHVVETPPDVREEAPTSEYIAPPLAPTPRPRPGTRTIIAMAGELPRWKLSRVGLTVDDAIEEEVNDYKMGLDGATGAEADAYAASQGDVVLWERFPDGREDACLAVIRPRVGGDPEVTRFDGEDGGWPSPVPSTESERAVWSYIKEFGADRCRTAISREVYPQLAPKPEPSLYVATTDGEQSALRMARNLGEQEALDRLYQTGVYGLIRGIMDRLGSDAVDHLRKLARTQEQETSGS